MEQLFLLALPDFLIIAVYLSITPFLLCVIPFQGFIEKLMVYFLDTLVAKFHVLDAPLFVHVLRAKCSCVVVDRAFPHHSADCSLQ